MLRTPGPSRAAPRPRHPNCERGRQFSPQRLTRSWRGRRGVLFLDPFATELEWATIKSVCGTKALDTWILFPVGAIRRMLPRWKKPEEVNEQWARRLYRIYGDDSWRDLYQPSEQLSLFGPPQERSNPGVDGLLRIYKDRLRGLFGDRFLDAQELKGISVVRVDVRSRQSKPASNRYRNSDRAAPLEGHPVMASSSRIEWTQTTWNPVTGCTKISQGCKHC